jgi:Cu-processing system permease protein
MKNSLFLLAMVTFKGGVRDRLFAAVIALAVLLVFSLPLFGTFSMRDVAGVSVSYSLSMISAMGVLLALFLGGNLIARDIQSRAIYTVATLPISRSRYILGKYLGLALLLFCSVALLGAINYCGLLFMVSQFPPEKPIIWTHYVLCLFLDFEKLLVLSGVLVLFTTVATSTFLPMALTLAVYVVGESTEKVKFFIETVQGAQNVSPSLRAFSQIIYYVFPNFSLFDLKTQVTYGLPLNSQAVLLTQGYALGYCTVMLVLACTFFAKRDFV